MAQDEVIPDLEEKVEELRRRLMSDAGQPLPEKIAASKVTALTPNGPFSPGEARHRPAKQDAASNTKRYFALLEQEKSERTASGGNR